MTLITDSHSIGCACLMVSSSNLLFCFLFPFFFSFKAQPGFLMFRVQAVSVGFSFNKEVPNLSSCQYGASWTDLFTILFHDRPL